MTQREDSATFRPQVRREAEPVRGPAASRRSSSPLPAIAAIVTLVLSGAGMVAVYGWMVQPMALADWFPGPGVAVGFGEMLGKDVDRQLLYIWGSAVALLILWAPALIAVRFVPRSIARWLVFVPPVLMYVVLAWLYPPHAADFLHNLADGRTFWIFHQSPLVATPDQTFPIGVTYGNAPAGYGPLWFVSLAPPVFAGGDDLLRALFLMKLWLCGWLLLCAAVAWLITRRLAPGREPFMIVLLLWNPFVTTRIGGNAHNDVVMMAFLLLALYAGVRRRWVAIPMLLAASTLVKYTTVLAAPAFLVYAWQQQPAERQRALWGIGAGLAWALLLTIIIFAPFWDGLNTFDSVRRQFSGFGMITSTPLVLANRLAWWNNQTEAAWMDRARTITLATYLVVFWLLLFRQKRGPLALTATTALLMLSYNLIAAGWYRPWYMLWAIMPAALVPGRWWTGLTIALSAGGMFPDFIEQNRYQYDYFIIHTFMALLAPILPAFLPGALVWLAGIASTRRLAMLRERPTPA